MASIAITGHRPPGLKLSYSETDFQKLYEFAKTQLPKYIPGNINMVYDGGALGWDQAVALYCLEHGIPYTLVLPAGISYPGIIWSPHSQLLANKLRQHAAQVDLIPSGYLGRDRRMVDQCDYVVALWSGCEDGGTAYTVKYAQRKGKPIFNLWQFYN